MTATELSQEIRAYCLANADDGRLRKSQRFFKEEFVGHGLTAPQLYSKAKEMQKIGDFDLPTVLESAPILKRHV
jgi:hypothetical protein